MTMPGSRVSGIGAARVEGRKGQAAAEGHEAGIRPLRGHGTKERFWGSPQLPHDLRPVAAACCWAHPGYGDSHSTPGHTLLGRFGKSGPRPPWDQVRQNCSQGEPGWSCPSAACFRTSGESEGQAHAPLPPTPRFPMAQQGWDFCPRDHGISSGGALKTHSPSPKPASRPASHTATSLWPHSTRGPAAESRQQS